MTAEVRGQGSTKRQVNHLLTPPLPGERLSVYEVYVPAGGWVGWPPHRHDGRAGSPHLDEVYYFRLDPGNGFAMHRSWDQDDGDGAYDEAVVAHDGSAVTVSGGWHTTVASPGSSMYTLALLAGDATDDERAAPPLFHPDHTVALG